MTAQILILTPRQATPPIVVVPRGPSGKAQAALARNPQAPIEAVLGVSIGTLLSPISTVALADGAQVIPIGTALAALLFVNGLLEPLGSFTVSSGNVQIPPAMQIIAGDTLTVQPF